MKLIKLSVLLLITMFVVSTFSMVTITTELTATTKTTAVDYKVNTPSQCSNPTLTYFITGGPGELYNVSSFTLPLSTCVKIVFHNADPTLDHTFSISANSAYNITYFNIYETPGKTGTNNFLTPSKSIKVKYFCQVPGHEAAGMLGYVTFSSSSGSKASPGFELISVFLGLMAVSGLVITKKKRFEKR